MCHSLVIRIDTFLRCIGVGQYSVSIHELHDERFEGSAQMTDHSLVHSRDDFTWVYARNVSGNHSS